MRGRNRRVSAIGNRYHLWLRTHTDLAAELREHCEDLLDDAGVTYDRVTARIKEWPSFRAKASKRNADGKYLYADPMNDIHDLVGVRITCFHSTEIPTVLAVLGQSFQVVKSIDKTAETRVAGGFGYGSHHLILEIGSTGRLAEYEGQKFEVQVRTVLQHAWAEFEHDIRYKGPDALDPRVDRAFTLAAGLIELADQQFDQIAAIHDGAPSNHASHAGDLAADHLPGTVAALAGNRFPRSRTQSYRWLEEILAANGITTVAELKELLNEADIAAVERAMKYQFDPGQVRIIDDLLLRRFGAQHIERTGETGSRPHRVQRLRKRLEALEAAGKS